MPNEGYGTDTYDVKPTNLTQIPFKKEFAAMLLDGRKTKTTRTRRYGKVGDQFEAWGGWFQLTNVERTILGKVAFENYREEGFETDFQFKHAWIQLHPRKGYDPSQGVWLHTFKRIK